MLQLYQLRSVIWTPDLKAEHISIIHVLTQYLYSSTFKLTLVSTTFRSIFKMFYKLIHALPLLALSLLALASPLEQREPTPGLIDNILNGVLSAVGQLIKDVLNGVKSGIDNAKTNKPLICLPSLDACCPCKSPIQLLHPDV